MVDRIRRLLPLSCCALLALTGCAQKQQGTATAATGPTPPPSAAERHGAPTVREPLDVTRFLPQPCSVLADAQLRQLDLPGPGTPDLDSSTARIVGPSCSWRNSPASSSLGILFVTGNRNGLADRYGARARGLIQGYWQETSVEGYPAVYNDDRDDRATGSCGMDVGVSDNLALYVDVRDRTGVKSCDRVAVVAAMVITTLRGKS